MKSYKRSSYTASHMIRFLTVILVWDLLAGAKQNGRKREELELYMEIHLVIYTNTIKVFDSQSQSCKSIQLINLKRN